MHDPNNGSVQFSPPPAPPPPPPPPAQPRRPPWPGWMSVDRIVRWLPDPLTTTVIAGREATVWFGVLTLIRSITVAAVSPVARIAVALVDASVARSALRVRKA